MAADSSDSVNFRIKREAGGVAGFMPSAGGYLARFQAVGPRPEPKDIRACRLVPPPAPAQTPAAS